MTSNPANFLDLASLRAKPLGRDPYDYIIVPGFVTGQGLDGIHRDFPNVPGPGSFPLPTLTYGSGFASFIAELEGPAFRQAVAEKFGVDLAGKPTMITVRGRCRADDGKIHTDTVSKIITVLIYLNPAWEAPGGRLRILRNGTDLENYADEVPPVAGTLLAFRRSENSWHGHESFEGDRRVLQLNWVVDQATVDREARRHKVSAFFKKLNPFRKVA